MDGCLSLTGRARKEERRSCQLRGRKWTKRKRKKTPPRQKKARREPRLVAQSRALWPGLLWAFRSSAPLLVRSLVPQLAQRGNGLNHSEERRSRQRQRQKRQLPQRKCPRQRSHPERQNQRERPHARLRQKWPQKGQRPKSRSASRLSRAELDLRPDGAKSASRN